MSDTGEKKEMSAVDIGAEILGHAAAIEAMCKGEKIGDPGLSQSHNDLNDILKDGMSGFDPGDIGK